MGRKFGIGEIKEKVTNFFHLFLRKNRQKSMSDEESSPEEVLLKQQRKEKKDLQAKIQGLKKSASKGDKKKKKETTEEIARLELELNEKHDKELKELQTQANDKKIESKSNDEVVNV